MLQDTVWVMVMQIATPDIGGCSSDSARFGRESRRRERLKRNHVLLIVLVLLATTIVPLVAGCGNDFKEQAVDDFIASIEKSDAIDKPDTIEGGWIQGGSDTAFPPMEFSDEKGGYIGFDVDLCTALAHKMGLKLQVVSTAWDGIIPGLLGDRYDIIMSAMSITEERLEQVNFTDAYLPGILAITAPIDAPVTKAEDLAGKIVGVQVDTTGQFAVEEIAGVKEIKKYPDILTAFQDLNAGRVEAVVNDEPVNAYIIQTNTDYKAKFANTGGIVTVNDYGYAIKKENTDLLKAMNAALAELIADGTYQKICDKWGLTGVK